MALIKTSFQPAKIVKGENQGLSVLTLEGWELRQGESQEKDMTTGELKFNDDGTPKMRSWELLLFKFDCIGIYKDAKTLTVSTGNELKEDSSLVKILQALEYHLPVLETEVDENGLETAKLEIDETTGIGYSQSPDFDTVEEHLNACIGKKYVAKVEKNSKGFWAIDVDTLKELKLATK